MAADSIKTNENESKYTTCGAGETGRLGELLAAELQPGDLVLLTGDLGAGKTHFTQGILRGLGYDGTVSSPTFVIVNEYEGGRLPVFHMDVYRLSSAEELYDAGFGEYLDRGGITVVEWADRIPELYDLPERIFSVAIRRRDDLGPERRDLTIVRPGSDFREEETKC